MMHRNLWGAATAVLCFGLALPASAEIETIEVTAQKRVSTLQATNISMTAITAADLEDRGVERVNDLTEYIPNINFAPNSNGNGFFIATRGIAQADATNLTRDPATALYIDGVYWGMTIGNMMDVLDIERIEALRGPQGDLYGRNSVAGAINIITRKPSGGVGNKTMARGGSSYRGDIRVYQEFPLLDTDDYSLSGNVSFATIHRDAFYKNDFGPDTYGEDRIAFRSALHGESGAFSGDMVVDYSYAKEQGVEMQLTWANALFGSTPLQVDTINACNGNSGSLQCRRRATKLNLDGPSAIGEGLRDDITENIGWSFSGSADLQELGLLDNAQLKSISGYRRVNNKTYNDRDGTQEDIFSGFENVEQWQFTQEFNLVGDISADWGNLDYIAGLFFFHEEGDLTNRQSADPNVSAFSSATTSPYVNNDAYAVYGHLSYVPPILDNRLKAEFGIRFTYEDRFIKQTAFGSGVCVDPLAPGCGAGGVFRGKAQKDFDQFTPSGRLSFDVNDDLTVYGSVAKGFLSGGFNGRATTIGTNSPADLNVPYESEDLLSYEAGFKFQGFDNRVRLTAAAYYVDYNDLQRTSIFFGPGGSIQSFVLNAEEAEIYGVEFELLLNPVEDLMINLGYGLAKSNYDLYCDFTNPFNPGAPNAKCAAGKTDYAKQRNFANTPENNVTAGIQYTYQLPKASITGRLDYYWQSETVLQNGDNPLAGMGSYGLLHARLTVGDINLPGDGGSLAIAFWGRNLTDEEYRPFGIDFGRYIVQTFGAERTYGIDVNYRFGTML
jgi:iron complex outermembrane receptor protein